MNWDKDIQNSLDAHLSGLHVSERQQAQMFNRIVRGEQPIMKKKISAALVFAIVMMIAMGSMALAAGLGLFGHFRQTQENNNGARLEKLETLADTYETTKAVAMPTPAVPVTGDTMYDKLLAEQYSHTFELTLDQAYCDGHKLYYSYTLRRSAPKATAHTPSTTAMNISESVRLSRNTSPTATFTKPCSLRMPGMYSGKKLFARKPEATSHRPSPRIAAPMQRGSIFATRPGQTSAVSPSTHSSAPPASGSHFICLKSSINDILPLLRGQLPGCAPAATAPSSCVSSSISAVTPSTLNAPDMRRAPDSV